MNAGAARCRYAWYGDDFTGASDTLATVAGAGLRALLFLGVPDPRYLEAAGPLDAVGIAGAARAMDVAAQADELAKVGPFLASLRAPVAHYKCCSTFDSSPRIGSLGNAVRQLKQHGYGAFVPIVGGQPSLGRYCAFGNLFATAGADRDVFRIDRHPTMSRHPVTPMHEADLRKHLATQGLNDVSLIDVRLLDDADDATLDRAVDALVAAGADAVLFDVTRTGHLTRIGRLLWQRALHAPLLALGASSVPQALLAHWRGAGELTPTVPVAAVGPADGPVFVLAGSQSPLTARQIDVATSVADATSGPRFQRVAIDADAIVQDARALGTIATQCADLLKRGIAVLAHTGSPRADGATPLEVARACGRLLACVLERAPSVRRVGVAGGDTSSMAVQALDIWALSYVGGLGPGVALVRAHADVPRLDGLELMLKGGQMGAPDLFARLLHGTA